jgi:hypothetical protein
MAPEDDDEKQVSVVDLFDELLMMEMLRSQRHLEPEEARRWVELQRHLTRELCEVPHNIDERRQYLRVATPLNVRVLTPGANFPAVVLDLGAGGMGLRADVLPFPGEQVTLAWAEMPSAEHYELDLPARVIWMRKATHELGPGFGIAFEPQTHEQDHRIAALLLILLRQEREMRG